MDTAVGALNSTYSTLLDNIANRHYSACDAALSPFNLPALGTFLYEDGFSSALSAGVRIFAVSVFM